MAASNINGNDSSDITSVEHLIGHTFTRKDLLKNALYFAGAFGALPEGNKGLAMVGDAVLRTLSISSSFGLGLPIGAMNTRMESVTNNARLAAVGYQNILGIFLHLAQGATEITDKGMSITVEALVGAAFMDGGMDAASRVATTLGIFSLDLHPMVAH